MKYFRDLTDEEKTEYLASWEESIKAIEDPEIRSSFERYYKMHLDNPSMLDSREILTEEEIEEWERQKEEDVRQLELEEELKLVFLDR